MLHTGQASSLSVHPVNENHRDHASEGKEWVRPLACTATSILGPRNKMEYISVPSFLILHTQINSRFKNSPSATVLVI